MYLPIVDLDEFNEKQTNIVLSTKEKKPEPFQTYYRPCEHGNYGIVIKYYSDEYGFLTTVKDAICKQCLKDD
jgi:hypothetical protein